MWLIIARKVTFETTFINMLTYKKKKSKILIYYSNNNIQLCRRLLILTAPCNTFLGNELVQGTPEL